MANVTPPAPPEEGTTTEDVAAQREKVDALREELRLEKQKVLTSASTGANDVKMESLLNEEQRLQADLAALRGPEAQAEFLASVEAERGEAKEVDGYIVPMGTVSVESEDVNISGEDANLPEDYVGPTTDDREPETTQPHPITSNEPPPAPPEAPAE